jgi:O-antigen ligase
VEKIRQHNNIPAEWKKYIIFYALSFAFIILNAYLVLKKDTLLGVLIPVVFLVILTAVYAYDKLIWLAVLFTPLSIPLDQMVHGLPFDMHMPTEPLLFGILLVFLLSFISGKRFDKKITHHPVSIVIFIYLIWMTITSASSSIPLVSFKFLLTRIWFIVIFFFLFTFLFKQQKNIDKFIFYFTLSFVPVILYAIIRHLGYGLYNDQAAHWVMTPFFNDHTSYGAVLAMFIPFLFGFAFSGWFQKKYKLWLWALLGLFLLAEVLSYTRAAWLSLIIAAGVWCIIKLKIKFKTLLITGISILAIGFLFQNQILQKLEQNSTDSSANFGDHISSMTNISTDASNLERINRWQCALAMFNEKPFLGWGPGTYAMKYAPYQLTKQRTIISTNSGDGGNAHSEYLGALADTGLIGMFSFILIIIMVLYTGINAYSRSNDPRIKTLLLSSLLGLITYYSHGLLNNFLDTDKASVPFWGFTAIIVALDLYTKEQKKSSGH